MYCNPRIISSLIFFVILWAACRAPQKDYTISFYHWKLKANNSDPALFNQWKPQHIYLHIMDINWNADKKIAEPQSTLNLPSHDALRNEALIPVIFIHNQVIAQSDSAALEVLAQKIIQVRRDFFSYHALNDSLQEIQIDCDWLKSHKDKYFYLLSKIKTLAPELTLSVTLRLYPYKYPNNMGIPPADYAVLMCYNMGDAHEYSKKRSILEPNLLKEYLNVKNVYPLPLKPALPTFGWWVLFQQEKFQNIIYLTKDFEQENFLEKISETQYQINIDTMINNIYMRKGDILRNEYPTISDINKSIKLLQRNIDFDEVIFYHWDEKLLRHYEEILQH